MQKTAASSGAANLRRICANSSATACTIPPKTKRRTSAKKKPRHFREWKATDVERFRRVVRKIIAFDLDIIENHADYVICYWDAQAKSGGTSAELTIAHRKGIPVYLVTTLPPQEISGWMLACSDQVFSSIEELKEFLTARFRARKTEPSLERLIEFAAHGENSGRRRQHAPPESECGQRSAGCHPHRF